MSNTKLTESEVVSKEILSSDLGRMYLVVLSSKMNQGGYNYFIVHQNTFSTITNSHGDFLFF